MRLNSASANGVMQKEDASTWLARLNKANPLLLGAPALDVSGVFGNLSYNVLGRQIDQIVGIHTPYGFAFPCVLLENHTPYGFR